MEKPERGMPITVLLADGKEHVIRFPLGILKELKTAHKIDLLRSASEIGQLMEDSERLALLLSYGLRSNDPGATVEWVEANVDAAMLFDIAPYLVYAATGRWLGDLQEAFERLVQNGSIRPNGAASKAPGETASASTGSASGPSDATTSDSPTATSGT